MTNTCEGGVVLLGLDVAGLSADLLRLDVPIRPLLCVTIAMKLFLSMQSK